jgi:hypothetical protein
MMVDASEIEIALPPPHLSQADTRRDQLCNGEWQ